MLFDPVTQNTCPEHQEILYYIIKDKKRLLPIGSIVVNSLSNCDVSRLLAIVGIQALGAVTSPERIPTNVKNRTLSMLAVPSHGMSSKNGCSLSSVASFAPLPRRLLGSRVKSRRRMSFALYTS